MLYKTMAMNLIQQRPELHEQLRSQRMLLAAVNSCANELMSLHETWKDSLSRARPDSDPNQIASEALEMALQALEDFLPSDSPPDENGPSLDGAMAFLRRPMPPG